MKDMAEMTLVGLVFGSLLFSLIVFALWVTPQ